MDTPDSPAVLRQVDHLIYGTPDLEATIESLDQLFGLRATIGGQHLGEGTRNALYSLGPAAYLEVLAPDPAQPEPDRPRWLGIDDLTEPRLVTWVAKATDLQQRVDDAAGQGIRLGRVLAGGRQRPDGSAINWHVTDPHTVVAEGVVPFLIDWGDSTHPASDVVQGLVLLDFRSEHPEPSSTRETLLQLALDLTVTEGPHPRLIATIDSPRGTIELD